MSYMAMKETMQEEGSFLEKCLHIPKSKARKAVYESLLARHGSLLQSVVALEELSECQKEICKILRGTGDIEHLAEEVADATIMLEQIILMYGIEKQVSRYIDAKVQRMVDRLEGKEV